MPDPHQAALLDELAANATAATVAQLVDGWWLRAAPDLPFRRANSVVPLAGPERPSLGVEERIDLVEAFYARWGLPARVQLGGAPSPADLDDRLAARGYEIDAPVEVVVARLDGLESAVTDGREDAVTVGPDLDEGWIAAYGALHAEGDAGTRSRLEAYAALLRTIGPTSAVARLDVDGRPGAVGVGVVERGWLGVFGMATRSDARRRGAARLVLGALARWGRSQGATQAYLQVETDNVAARALYESAGFAPSHRYHYRVRASR